VPVFSSQPWQVANATTASTCGVGGACPLISGEIQINPGQVISGRQLAEAWSSIDQSPGVISIRSDAAADGVQVGVNHYAGGSGSTRANFDLIVTEPIDVRLTVLIPTGNAEFRIDGPNTAIQADMVSFRDLCGGFAPNGGCAGIMLNLEPGTYHVSSMAGAAFSQHMLGMRRGMAGAMLAIPIPEPATWGAALIALVALVFAKRNGVRRA
jgi:hypothetical protein